MPGVGVGQPLWMPLDPKQPGRLYRPYQPVGTPGRGPQPGPRRGHRLMMNGVHAGGAPKRRQGRGAGSGLDVTDRLVLAGLVRVPGEARRGEIGKQRPTVGNGHDLDAAADPGHRAAGSDRVPRAAISISSRSGRAPLTPAVFAAIADGVDVGAAGQDKSVAAVDHLQRPLGVRTLPAGTMTG